MVACDGLFDPVCDCENETLVNIGCECELEGHLWASLSRSARCPWHMPHVGSSSAGQQENEQEEKEYEKESVSA